MIKVSSFHLAYKVNSKEIEVNDKSFSRDIPRFIKLSSSNFVLLYFIYELLISTLFIAKIEFIKWIDNDYKNIFIKIYLTYSQKEIKIEFNALRLSRDFPKFSNPELLKVKLLYYRSNN